MGTTFRFEVWGKTSSGPLTGSKTLETTVYDGGGKKIDIIELFSPFKEKKAASSSLKDLAEVNKRLSNLISGGGKASSKRPPAGPTGMYALTEQEFINFLPVAEQLVQEGMKHAHRIGNDLPRFFTQIRESYTDSNHYIDPAIEDLISAEQARIMVRFKPEQLYPSFGVKDVFKANGVIGRSEHEDLIQQAIIKSDMQSKIDRVIWAEDLIIASLEKIRGEKKDGSYVGVQRGRGQVDALVYALEKCEDIVSDFSDNPDLVENLKATLKMAKKIDATPNGLKASLDIASEALAIFETKEEPYDNQGGYSHNPDEPVQPTLTGPIPDDFF